LEQKLLVLFAQVGKAGDFVGEMSNDVHGGCQQAVELLNLLRLGDRRLEGVWFSILKRNVSYERLKIWSSLQCAIYGVCLQYVKIGKCINF
jgi:hypothetical protein